MQLALTPEVLFPLGAGAVVAVAVIAVVVVLVLLVRSGRTVPEESRPPTAADWTGEAATADTAPSAERSVLPALPPRLTVAEAIAVRDADTAPLPVSSAAFVVAAPTAAVPTMVAAPTDAVPGSTGPDGSGSSRYGMSQGELDQGELDQGELDQGELDQGEPDTPEAIPADPEQPGDSAEHGRAEHVPAAPEPAVQPPAEADVQAEPAPVVGAASEFLADPGAEQPAAVEPPVSAAQPPEPGPRPAPAPVTSSGSNPTVAAAVVHALAVRAAANREPAGEPAVPSRTADARDRLLAVLLADPVRAVGAAEELATCRGQLGDVLSRLAASGLSTSQLARLSGFTVEQVATLLERQNA